MVVLEKIRQTPEEELLTYFSGAVGKCTDTRSFQKNREIAFVRMAKSEKFIKWQRIEIARRLGQLKNIEEEVDKQMIDSNLKIEYL